MLTPALITQGEELLKKAAPGPWILHDSCSWRRFSSSRVGADGDVLCPMIDADGHPNLDMPHKNADLILFLVNHASELLQCARERHNLMQHVIDLAADHGYKDFAAYLNKLDRGEDA